MGLRLISGLLQAVYRASRALVCFFGACCVAQAHAQALRDPTEPPVSLRSSPANPSVAVDQDAPPVGPFSLMCVDGQPRLLVGTRAYKQGEHWNGYTVEKFFASEVWVSKNRKLHKLPFLSVRVPTQRNSTLQLPCQELGS